MRFVAIAAVVAVLASSPVAAQGKGHGKEGGGGGPPAHAGGGGGGGPKGDRGPGGGGGPKADRGLGGSGGPKADPQGNRGNGKAKADRNGNARADRGPPPQARGNEGRGNQGRGNEPRGNPGQAKHGDTGPGNGRGNQGIGNQAQGKPGRGQDGRFEQAGPAVGGPQHRPDGARGNGNGGNGNGNGRGKADRAIFVDNGRYIAGAPALITGCPPGLAKKDNGCLPPGQARKIWGNPEPWRNWYGDWSGYRADPRWDYRYDDGYLYRVDRSTSLISAFLPLLGGALFTGNVWPTSYSDYEMPDYYGDYYGWDDGVDYRYADGAIFGVDPGTNQIMGIAGLLTGNQWSVGSLMPAGYDLYNLPPQYRDRWADGADDWYRYSDGYVYQVDPKTRLVEQVFSLLS